MVERTRDGARILLPDDVRRLLPWNTAIDAMRAMFQDLGEARAGQPPRVVMPLPGGGGVLGLMPSWAQPRDRARPVMAVKTISVFNANRARGLESHQGAVLLFDGEDGRLLAIVDAASLTAIRTAAVTALATDILAPPEAHSLALLGSGTQAHLHLSALGTVRDINRLWVWSPTPAHREALAADARAMGIRAEASEDARTAVTDADIITTLTPARAPILAGEWLRAGVHVNAAGASVPGFRELAADVVGRAAVYVDWREAALREADDVRLPIEDGVVAEAHVKGDLTDLVRGAVPPRPAGTVTLFKSVGLALEDAYAALFVLDGAEREGRGQLAAFQSRRD
ncbi:MAG: ornithine cyclodeaminase family protein [Clostridia bacterium]